MTDRPILFSGPMVRALLDGRKTQTRRIVNPQPSGGSTILVGRYEPAVVDRHGELQPGPEVFGAYDEDGEWGCVCPYGEPHGDRLWVRETWGTVKGNGIRVVYRADGDPPIDAHHGTPIPGRMVWTPSIHMPRIRSRITLAVTSVRVERLQEITEEDAKAEGVESGASWSSHRNEFVLLWNAINGSRATWASNPHVWVVGFEVVR
jgi:hypothetical protein